MPTSDSQEVAGRRLKRSVIGAFVLATIILTVVGTMSLRSLAAMQAEGEARNRASQTLFKLSSLLTRMLDAETGERGFLLTGNPEFLEPLHSALTNLGQDTAVFAVLIPLDSTLAPDVDRLSGLIGVQLAGLDTAIQLRNRGEPDSVRSLVLAHKNKGVMDQIRHIVNQIQQSLIAERELRSGQLAVAAAQTRSVVLISLGLMIVALILSARVLVASLQSQARSVAETKAAELRLTAILEQMPLGVLVVNPAGVPQFANQMAKKILGRDAGPEEVVDRMPETFQVYRSGSDELYPVAELPIARALRGEQVYDAGIDIHSPDGIVPVEAWAAPVRDAAGRMVLAIAAFADISKRLAAEKAVRDSEQKFQDILNSIPLGITVTDSNGTPTFLNMAGRKLLGRDLVPEVPTAKLSEFYPVYLAGTKERYPADRRGITRALGGEHWYADDLEIHTPERVVPLEVWSAPVYDSTGELVMAISAYGDISERLAADRSIKENERRLRQILDSIPLGISVADGYGVPTFLNSAGRKLLGRDLVPGAANAKLSELYQVYVAGTNDLYPAERRGINRALRGEASYADDLEFRGPERTVPIEVWTAPVYDSGGTLVMAISAYADISQRLQNQREIEALTQRLTRQVDELAAVNKELESFSYSVAHDLRAPLRAISGFSGMLLEDYTGALDSEGLRLLTVVRDNAIRMGTLIDDLLAFSRLSRQKLSPRDVDMMALVNQVTDELMQAMPENTVRPTIEPLPMARGDATLLRQVWSNLISNALKYSRTSAAPMVEIGSIAAPVERSGVVYFVRDNGVGFDMAHADKLFGVFQRLHRADEFEGTGVGLAIVHRVIARHGGRIWPRSTAGEGATFFFTLPPDGAAS